MPLNPKKRPDQTPKIGRKLRNRRRRRFLAGRFLASTSLVATMSAPFGLRPHPETTMDDALENVQPYPVELRPERRGEGNSLVSQRGRGGPHGG
jgi:hypothetical protein